MSVVDNVRTQALLDAVEDLVATATPDGVITSINRAGLALLGLGRQRPDGLRLDQLLPQHTAAAIRDDFLPRARDDGPWIGELPMQRSDGSVFPVDLKLVWVESPHGEPEFVIVARDLTHAKRAQSVEAQLLRELYELKTVIDSTSDFVAMASLEGQISFVNPAGMSMCGRAGQDYRELEVSDFQPRDVHKLIDVVFPYVRKHGAWLGELQFTHANGTPIPVSQVITVVRNQDGEVIGYATIARNITARRRAEAEREELLADLERLKSVIDTTTDFVALAAPDRQIVYLNPAGERLLGRDKSDVVSLNDALPPDTRRRLASEIFPQVEANGHWLGELNLLRHDGVDVPVSQAVTRVRDDRGETIGYGMIARDISDSKLAAAELRKAKEAAEAANLAKSEFLANMSHELRTPLNVILGFTQLLVRDERLNPHQREQIETVNHAGRHLLRLINDVLEMSKIEAGRTVLTPDDFEPAALLRELENMFQLRADTRGVDLQFNCIHTIPEVVHSDEAKLRQVLINLLDNALKFTTEGEVVVETDYRPGRLGFCVRDTGPGIAAEEFGNLFQAFSQTKTGRNHHEGTGLGLSISRHFVRMMGGDIEVESTPGCGATFRFEIDVTIPARPRAAGTKAREVVALDPRQTPPKILIVEDREPNRLVLLHLLGPLGFELRGALNGVEAIEVYEAWDPDLILMDIRMPVMDGYEATRQIRAREESRRPVIVALTANAFVEDRSRMKAAGCDDIICKPFHDGEILDCIARFLGVTYLYREPSTEIAKPQAERHYVDALQQMGLAWCQQLQAATVRADYSQLLSLLEDAKRDAPELATTLEQWIKNFDYDAISDLLGACELADNSS